jgi:hypothetical protein
MPHAARVPAREQRTRSICLVGISTLSYMHGFSHRKDLDTRPRFLLEGNRAKL